MELHTLGVDGGYTQHDVVELARILTGWTIDRPQRRRPVRVPSAACTTTGDEDRCSGTTFPSGTGEDEGERALDLLARHPSTAHHIAFKLAQRFVADEPPAALVDRAAKTFLDTKGDLREVTRLIVTSPEFFDATAYRAKVKTPLEFVVSAVARGGRERRERPADRAGAARNLGMPLYGCAAADRLQHDGRRVGQHGRAASTG